MLKKKLPKLYENGKSIIWLHVAIKKETKDLIDDEVKKEFLRVNPSYHGAKITYNQLIYHMAKFYIEVRL
jgi:hypothetical protein